MAIFNNAMKDHLGVRFAPLAVASQVVEGMNYIFICTGTPVALHPEAKLYAVKIFTHFAPSDAPTVRVESINEIDVPGLVHKKNPA